MHILNKMWNHWQFVSNIYIYVLDEYHLKLESRMSLFLFKKNVYICEEVHGVHSVTKNSAVYKYHYHYFVWGGSDL